MTITPTSADVSERTDGGHARTRVGNDPAPDLQTRLGVEPIDALVIDQPAFLAQYQIDHAGAVATMAVREGHNAVTQAGIGIRPRHIPPGGGAHVHDRQRAPLAEATRDHLPHHLAPDWCGHHFFVRPRG